MLRIPFILLLNLLGLARYGAASAISALSSAFRRKKRRYVKLSIEGGLPFGHPRGFARFGKSEATFLDIRRDIKTLAGDTNVAGVLLTPGKSQLGAARNADLLEELDKLRGAGKHVVAHAAMYQTRDYLEATAADDVLVAPAGRLYTFSPRFEQYFLAGAFQKHGIDAQFVHIGAYKAAASRYVATSLSSPQTAMMTELRDGLVDRVMSRVADRRRLTVAAATRLFDGPLDSRSAQGAGLLDGEAFEDDLRRWLESPDQHAHHADPSDASDDDAVELQTFADYIDGRPKPFRWRPLRRRRPVLALVDLSGIIVQDGLSLPGSASVIDPKQVIPLLRKLERDPRVAGVLLHINSPGGSALSSDLIWNAVANLRAEKPVVAYCSDVAASGGYYIAVGADRIVCRPETITGSIGVVAGKFTVGGALGRLGVTTQSIDGDDGSEFGSLFTPLSTQTLDHLQDDARAFYRRFLQRVGQARAIDRRRLHRYARGRVYLGEQALARDLVDDTGGFEAAVRQLKTLVAGEGPALGDDVELKHFPHQTRTLKDMLKHSALQVSGANAVLEPLAIAQMMRKDPLLALMPWRLTSGTS